MPRTVQNDPFHARGLDLVDELVAAPLGPVRLAVRATLTVPRVRFGEFMEGTNDDQ